MVLKIQNTLIPHKVTLTDYMIIIFLLSPVVFFFLYNLDQDLVYLFIYIYCTNVSEALTDGLLLADSTMPRVILDTCLISPVHSW